MYSAAASRERDVAVLSNFEKARGIEEQLIREHPGDRSLRSDLGWTLIMEKWRALEPAPEKDVGMKAIAVFRQLVAEDPADPFARDDLGWAIYRETLQRFDRDALSLGAEAVAIREQLVKEYPASMEFRRDLANSIHTYSVCAYALDKTPAKADEGLAASRRALDLLQSVISDLQADRAEARQPERPSQAAARIVTPNILYTTRDLGFAYGWIGEFAEEKGDLSTAGKMLDQATAIYKEVVERSPTVSAFAGELARRFHGRISLAQQAGDRAGAAACSHEAVAFWKRLAGLHPEVRVLQDNADAAVKEEMAVAQWAAGGAGTRP
jgi:tetratricopeptide (TPR) repeat protein